jgi:hypothetical protein
LTEEQISTLDEHVDELRAADGQTQDHIIGKILRHFERNFKSASEDDKFDSKAVEIVRTPSVALTHSQTFLAYSPVHLPPNQAGSDTIPFRNWWGSWRKVRT